MNFKIIIMEGDNGLSKKAGIISLQTRLVDKAVKAWYKGNRENNPDLIVEARRQLEHYKYIDLVAKYFAGAANLQLRDDNTEKHLIDILEALEELLKSSRLDQEQLLKSAREILKFLTEIDELFPDNYAMPHVPTLEEVLQVLSELNKRGLDKGMLAEFYSYLNAYLGR